eukprot:742154-Rhodomonas_salina.1
MTPSSPLPRTAIHGAISAGSACTAEYLGYLIQSSARQHRRTELLACRGDRKGWVGALRGGWYGCTVRSKFKLRYNFRSQNAILLPGIICTELFGANVQHSTSSTFFCTLERMHVTRGNNSRIEPRDCK